MEYVTPHLTRGGGARAEAACGVEEHTTGFTGGQRERFGLGGMGPDLFCPRGRIDDPRASVIKRNRHSHGSPDFSSLYPGYGSRAAAANIDAAKFKIATSVPA